jgi:DMSO/TMAO reductase YedYZ molybdopterin-dependent catalytic subunit
MTQKTMKLISLMIAMALVAPSCSILPGKPSKPKSTPTVTSPTPASVTQPAPPGTAYPLPGTQNAPAPTTVLTSTLATAPEKAALTITGNVKSPKSWTLTELKAMPVVRASVKNKKGKTENYSGVAIVELLKQVELQPEPNKISFVNNKGVRISYTLKFIQSCANCMLSSNAQGALNLVMPGLGDYLPLKGVVEIQVK